MDSCAIGKIRNLAVCLRGLNRPGNASHESYPLKNIQDILSIFTRVQVLVLADLLRGLDGKDFKITYMTEISAKELQAVSKRTPRDVADRSIYRRLPTLYELDNEVPSLFRTLIYEFETIYKIHFLRSSDINIRELERQWQSNPALVGRNAPAVVENIMMSSNTKRNLSAFFGREGDIRNLRLLNWQERLFEYEVGAALIKGLDAQIAHLDSVLDCLFTDVDIDFVNSLFKRHQGWDMYDVLKRRKELIVARGFRDIMIGEAEEGG